MLQHFEREANVIRGEIAAFEELLADMAAAPPPGIPPAPRPLTSINENLSALGMKPIGGDPVA